MFQWSTTAGRREGEGVEEVEVKGSGGVVRRMVRGWRRWDVD